MLKELMCYTHEDVESFLNEKLVTDNNTLIDFSFRSSDDIILIVVTDNYIISSDNYDIEIQRNDKCRSKRIITTMSLLLIDNNFVLHIADTNDLYLLNTAEIER